MLIAKREIKPIFGRGELVKSIKTNTVHLNTNNGAEMSLSEMNLPVGDVGKNIFT